MLRPGAYLRPTLNEALRISSLERGSRFYVRPFLKLGEPVLYVRFVRKPEPAARTPPHSRRPSRSPCEGVALRASRDSTHSRDSRERSAPPPKVARLKLV